MQGNDRAEADRRFIDAAARLAMRHAGRTAENPSVGCLIVRGDRIVGRGVTATGGRPHAERIALAEAGELARGATAYVTLEPCAHHGRTPPCTEALLAAAIGRVVIAAADPDPRVDGRGIAQLRTVGVAVALTGGVNLRSIEGFLCRVRHRRPFVTQKLAVSADGFIGRAGAGQVAISGAVSNRQTHLLRARSDLVMIGIGTALADDPLLTVRLAGLADRSPARLVVDPAGRLTETARLVRSAGDVPLMLAGRPRAPGPQALAGRGVTLLSLTEGVDALADLMAELARRNVSTVLCEGGARLAASLLRDDLVDRLILIRSSRPIGAPGIAMPDLDPYLSRLQASDARVFGDDRWCEYDRRTD